MATWRKLGEGFANTRTLRYATATQLYFADDIALVNGEPPNEATLYRSAGLPQIGSVSPDPDLDGAVVVSQSLVGDCIQIGTTARAIIAITYDSRLYWGRITPRVRKRIYGEPLQIKVPIITRIEVAGPSGSGTGQFIDRRDEVRGWRAVTIRDYIVRIAGNEEEFEEFVNQITPNVGRGYVISTIPHILKDFSVEPLGNGQCEITYRFWTIARVTAIPGGTYGPNTQLAVALDYLEEWVVDLDTGTITKLTAADLYDAGTNLPGNVP